MAKIYTDKNRLQVAKEYRAGKHSFKHPENASKLAEMHENAVAKHKAQKAAKTGKLPKFGTNNMETRRKLMGKKSTTEHFEQ